MGDLKIDIIVAVRNEESTLKNFIDKIRSIEIPEAILTIIFIEDGSTDNTRQKIREFSNSDSGIAYYFLENPFGQGIALTYGLLTSRAEGAISIDIDGSHPIHLIQVMIDRLRDGYDVIQGNRISYLRKQYYRKIGSKIYFALFTVFTGVKLHKQNVHFRLMSQKALEIFRNNPSWWYSLRTKFKKSFKLKILYIDFEAPERLAGRSKFTFEKLLFFAYGSFLSLTNPWIFLLLNIPVIFLIAYFEFLNGFIAIVVSILVLSNIIFYFNWHYKDYIKRIKVLESSIK
jgi:glycosyltransferase involved in cell wall biosynthesis